MTQCQQSAQDEILRAANALFESGSVVELRILASRNGRRPTIAGYFDDFGALAKAAARYSGQSGIEGLYWTLNPCNPALLARCDNHVNNLKDTTSDNDIRKRSRFFIDCDPARPKGISSTEKEKALAKATADRVSGHLHDAGWPEAFFADSGNGYHLLFPIDLPNDAASRDLIKACLAALAALFDSDGVKIDRAVFNAARICKVYGSVAAKGESTKDRPHRASRLLQAPESPQIVSRAQLEALAAKAPQQNAPHNSSTKNTPEKVEEFLALAGIECRARVPLGDGWKWQLERCLFDPRHTATSVIVTLGSNGALGYHCSHVSCAENKWDKFREAAEQKIGRKFYFVDAASSGSTEWPDPAPLSDELPPVQEFTSELLPSSFLPLVEDISERMQTPMDYAAASAVVALAACVNRRATMQPKAEDTSWQKVPNLWGAVIAPPGYLKSPVQRQITKPLEDIEKEWRLEYEQEEEAYALKKKESELAWQAWAEETKRAIKKGTAKPPRAAKTPEPPTHKRLILTSATFEKLHEILQDNPQGVFVLRDELTGWLAELDKQGRETERQFYLEAWNGDTGFSVDRIGRGSVFVPATCVSLLGNIQPARLRSYLSDAVVGGPNDDGLIQRFQILVWPNAPSEWKLIDRTPNNYAVMKAAKVFSRLANLPSDSPLALRFDVEGQQLFFAWLAELENRVRGESALHPAMIAHLSKYRSLMPSLAALFELADRAATMEEPDQFPDKISVSIEHTKQAAALCDYLESHAHRVYSCIVSPQSRAARELARHLQAGDLKNPFRTRDVYLKGWSGLDDPERARNACKFLEDAAWIREEESPRSQRGGRPSETWLLNPKVVRREK